MNDDDKDQKNNEFWNQLTTKKNTPPINKLTTDGVCAAFKVAAGDEVFLHFKEA